MVNLKNEVYFILFVKSVNTLTCNKISKGHTLFFYIPSLLILVFPILRAGELALVFSLNPGYHRLNMT